MVSETNVVGCTHAVSEGLDYIQIDVDKRNAGDACFLNLQCTLPQNDESFTKSQVKSYFAKLKSFFEPNNKQLFELFYFI